MEIPGVTIGKDEESRKLLYKYQYAFLNMQKSFTSLIKILKGYIQRRLCKSICLWKIKIRPPYAVFRNNIILFQSKIRVVEAKFKNISNSALHKFFFRMITTSRIQKYYLDLYAKYKSAKDENKKELLAMNAEVKTLKMGQVELEIITNYYTKNEISLKDKIRKLSGKNSIENLRSQNIELGQQIDELYRKTINLFEDLHGMIDLYENNKKNKVKKGKKKTSVVSRKTFLPVCT